MACGQLNHGKNNDRQEVRTCSLQVLFPRSPDISGLWLAGYLPQNSWGLRAECDWQDKLAEQWQDQKTCA